MKIKKNYSTILLRDSAIRTPEFTGLHRSGAILYRIGLMFTLDEVIPDETQERTTTTLLTRVSILINSGQGYRLSNNLLLSMADSTQGTALITSANLGEFFNAAVLLKMLKPRFEKTNQNKAHIRTAFAKRNTKNFDRTYLHFTSPVISNVKDGYCKLGLASTECEKYDRSVGLFML